MIKYYNNHLFNHICDKHSLNLFREHGNQSAFVLVKGKNIYSTFKNGS